MKKNPDASPMRDATNNDSLHNHGIVNEAGERGQTFIKAYGLDRSTETGSAMAERVGERAMGGSTDQCRRIRCVAPPLNQTGRSRG